MPPEDRKISDVILELEAKVQKLVGVCQNMENNTKIILDKLNKLSAPQKTIVKTKEIVQPAVGGPKSIVAVPAPPPLPVDPSNPELSVETVQKGKRRDLRQPVDPSQNKKVTVSQQIVLPNGEGVYLASVEIMDSTGNRIKQTRTNDKGRWAAPLEAGEYSVHILKRPTDTMKLPIDLKYKIMIPESTKPMELPSPVLGDIYLK